MLVKKIKHCSFINITDKEDFIFVRLPLAWYTLFIRPGNTWPSSILKLSCGPNTFVGITEVK